MIEVDIVIISYAKTPELWEATIDGILSILQSEEQISFNIFVVESNKDITYNIPNVSTIHTDEPFNYNRYLNIGIGHGSAEYIFLANNDLTYEKGWASEIVLQMRENPLLLSASPFCPQTQHKSDWEHKEVHEGNSVRRELAGWAIFQQRKIYKIIGMLDDGCDFWYSDNLYQVQLQKYGITHALITNSIVNHHEHNLGKTGTSILDQATMTEYTVGQYEKFISARNRILTNKT